MNWMIRNTSFLSKLAVLLVMAVPAFAGNQQDNNKKNPPPKQSAAAAKPNSQPQQHPASPRQKPSPVPPKTPPTPKRPEPPLPKTPPKGPKEIKLPGGGSARVGANGQIRSIDRNGMHIEHNLHGGRTIVSTTSSGARIVTTGKAGGYVQRKYVSRGGHDYYSRTYYEHGVSRSVVYRGYVYGGRTYYAYSPGYYYRPAFYAWAYSPWPSPLYWDAVAWGWGGAPWYGYYAFTPYPSYAGPSYWLTDYLVASNLQAAYGDASPSGGTQVVDPGNQSCPVGGGDSASAEATGPVITGVSLISAKQNQTIVISGHTFGAQIPYNGDSNYIMLSDITRNWNAGHSGNAVNLIVEQWTDCRIVLQGFSGSYGGGWSVANGDVENVQVWNVQSGAGPATFSVKIGVIPPPPPTPVVAETPPPVPGAAVAGGESITLTSDVKQAIAEEVKSQLQAEQTAADQAGQNASANTPTAPARDEVPPALDPAHRTFIVNTDLAVDANGQECSLTSGDVLMRLTDAPDANQKVNVSVTSSKKNDCKAGNTVAVSVDDLQEMQNHFREQLDRGMKELASKQGTGKMPKAPDTATLASDVPPPQPDSSGEKMLQEQQAAADQAETQVKQEATSGSAGGQH
jgi:hypothetical protein